MIADLSVAASVFPDSGASDLSGEFVKDVHDTANAVTVVIYSHSLKPIVAVVWSGLWNLLEPFRAGLALLGAGLC